MHVMYNKCLLTVNSMFFARVDSAMLANGLSAPQHSTYLVILLEGLDLTGGPPGVAIPCVVSPARWSAPLLPLLSTFDDDKRVLTFPFLVPDAVSPWGRNIRSNSIGAPEIIRGKTSAKPRAIDFNGDNAIFSNRSLWTRLILAEDEARLQAAY